MAAGDDLIQNVYTYFLGAYRQATSGASPGELLAFEAIGFSPGCSGLSGTNAAAVALEELSRFTDILPQIEGGIYTRTMRTISGTYGNMLDAAEPSSAASITTFSDLKSQAQEAYKATLGSFEGPTTYHPTYPTPIDWYDLNKPANWQSYSYNTAAQTPAPVPTPTSTPTPKPPAPAPPNVRVQWHVVPQEMRPLILERAAPVRPVQPQSGVHPLSISTLSPASRALVANAAVPAAPSPHPTPTPLMHPVAVTGLASVAKIATQTQPQPVETPHFTMSFDYCLVQLSRQWLSGDLLATTSWYVPGAHQGDYASGGPANTGPFAVLPTAFIAIKNLVIDGAWSNNDIAARANAAAFGPFSLLGRSIDNKNAIHCPGIQIIAWICSFQPQLPPDTDPTLPAPVVTPSGNPPPPPNPQPAPASATGSPSPTTIGSSPANSPQPASTSTTVSHGNSGAGNSNPSGQGSGS